MKLTAVFLLMASLQLSARGYSQTITLKEKKAGLQEVFKAIERQTGYTFLFEKALLAKSGKVDIDVAGASLESVLDICFKDQPLTYRIFDKTIVVRQKEAAPAPGPAAAETVDLTGLITDANGKPLEGATVRLVGTNIIVTTDAKGEFILRGINGNGLLEISFVGYRTQRIHIDNRTAVTIGLATSDSKLDEVVVMAYGTTTQRYNTGSISKVTADQIEKQPVGNILLALEGLVPGLDVQPSNGYGSGNVAVTIRGLKDLLYRNQYSPSPSVPLYVIDGVPLATSNGDPNNAGLSQNGFLGTNNGQSPLYSINPADVESVEVLKDADATAIYGSRGANGVILITTKKGKAGKSVLQLTAYDGVTKMPQHLNLLNTPQYLKMRREAFANDGITPAVYNAPDLLTWDTTRYTDWQKELATAGKVYDAQLSYSGGNEFTNFRLSGGYHNQAPPIPDGFPNHFHDYRVTALATLSHTSADRKFTFSLTVNDAITNNTLAGGNFYQYDLPPDAPSILDSTGKLNWNGWGTAMPYNFEALFQPYKSNTNDLLSNLTLSYHFWKGFAFTTSMGYTTTHMNQVQAVPASTQGPDPSQYQGYAGFGTNDFNSWIVEPRATYDIKLGGGSLEAMAGGTLQQDITSGSNITAYGFSNDALLGNLASASSLYAQSNYALYRFQGYYTRVNYNWKGKYILNLSGRVDGSSRFKSGYQMGDFGSAGAAWIFSEESFVKRALPFLSFGKLRASYGSTGSAVASDYQYLSLWQSGSSYGGTSTLNLINPYNPNFQWQVNKKAEAALELGFLRDRILLTAAGYRERMDNELVNYPLPAFTGFSSVVNNLPAIVQNSGFEFTLNTTNIKSRDFSWTTIFTISRNKNLLVSFPGLANSSYAEDYIVGKPTTIQLLYHYQGINPQTGQYQFEHVDKDSVIDQGDLIGKYDLAPKFFGGFQNTVTWKNWELSCLFQFKDQTGPYTVSTGVPGTMRNQPVAVLGRWQKPGDVTNIGPFSTESSTGYYNYTLSDANWENASYVRLQNLSISYHLNGNWMKRAKLSNCRIYLQGQNLFTITSYKGNDPANPSLTVYTLPVQKFYTGGIQFTF